MVPYRKIDHGFTSNRALSKTFLCLVSCYWAIPFLLLQTVCYTLFRRIIIYLLVPINLHMVLYVSKGLKVTRKKRNLCMPKCLYACCGHCWHMLRRTSNPFISMVRGTCEKVCSFGSMHTCCVYQFQCVSIQQVSFVKDWCSCTMVPCDGDMVVLYIMFGAK